MRPSFGEISYLHLFLKFKNFDNFLLKLNNIARTQGNTLSSVGKYSDTLSYDLPPHYLNYKSLVITSYNHDLPSKQL